MTYRAWEQKPLDRAAVRELTAAIAEQAAAQLEEQAMDEAPWSDEKYKAVLAAQQKENALLAGILAARGITDPAEALTLLAGEEELSDPALLTDMDARRPIFHLILERAEGTPYAAPIDQMVTLEVEATERYTQVLRSMGKTVPDIDRRLEHMLVTGMMNAYCEIIIHDMHIEDAQRYREELGDFYTAGWLKIMGQ